MLTTSLWTTTFFSHFPFLYSPTKLCCRCEFNELWLDSFSLLFTLPKSVLTLHFSGGGEKCIDASLNSDFIWRRRYGSCCWWWWWWRGKCINEGLFDSIKLWHSCESVEVFVARFPLLSFEKRCAAMWAEYCLNEYTYTPNKWLSEVDIGMTVDWI